MFFALLRRQSVICMYSAFVKMTEDARQSYLTVATIMMALWSLKFLPPYVLAYRYCCCGLFCVYSKVCEISCSYIDYSYIIIIAIVLYNDIKKEMRYEFN